MLNIRKVYTGKGVAYEIWPSNPGMDRAFCVRASSPGEVALACLHHYGTDGQHCKNSVHGCPLCNEEHTTPIRPLGTRAVTWRDLAELIEQWGAALPPGLLPPPCGHLRSRQIEMGIGDMRCDAPVPEWIVDAYWCEYSIAKP